MIHWQHTSGTHPPRPCGYLCILYISLVRSDSKTLLRLIDWPLRWVGNWLTQWQRSHLSRHWQQSALSSSNFLQLHQIVAVIASSQPGSQPPPAPSTTTRTFLFTIFISLKGPRKAVTHLGLLGEINSLQTIWTTPTKWRTLIETFMSDAFLCQHKCNTQMCDELCKHAVIQHC